MKKIMKIGIILSVVMGGGLSGCSNEGVEEAAALPDGTYPLELAALRLSDTYTRSVSGKDNWTGNGSEEIGVSIIQDGAESNGLYTIVSVEGETEAATSAYWQSNGTATVRAWYPASLSDGDVSISDQSDQAKFAACDFLTATAVSVAFGTKPALQFAHAMAKVRVVLTGTGAASVTGVSVQGSTSVRLSRDSEGRCCLVPVSSTTGTITACRDDSDTNVVAYEALLAPETVTPSAFISVTAGSYSYVFSLEKAKTLEAGTPYVYTLTLSF